MSNEINTANVEAEPSSMENTNMSVLDFASRRAKQLEGMLGQPAPTPEPEVEQEEEFESEAEVPEVEAAEHESEEAEPQEEEASVLSKDLDDLSEDELQELASKLGSRAVKRFGELTAKRKAAEERLAALEAKLNQKDENPLQRESEVKDNPYKDIDTIEALQGKAEETNQVIEWAEEILFNSDGYAADDIVTEVDGKELTKSDVRKAMLNARKTRDKYLPAQLKTIQTQHQAAQMKEAFQAKAIEELSWMQGEDNDTRKHYEAMVSDPRFEQLSKSLKSLDPTIDAQLPYILAHAANSLYGKKEAPVKTSQRITPPSNAFSNASAPEKTAPKSAKAISEMSKRFKETGDKNDFITLRTLQLSNKFK